MKNRASRAIHDGEQYHASDFYKTSPKKRLDLNDLIKRAEEQKKSDKKINILIYSGVATVIVIFVTFLNL